MDLQQMLNDMLKKQKQNGGNNMNYGYETEAPKKGNKFNIITKGIAIGVGAILVVTIAANSYTRVDPGYAGVQYSLFGGLKKDVLAEGGHIHLPWINVTEYPVSTETVQLRNSKKGEDDRPDNSLQVNTSGGKTVSADVRYAYKFKGDRLPEIFKRFRRQDAEWIADNYVKQIILDTIQSQTTKHSVLEVYSEQRDEITKASKETITKLLAEDGIVLEKFTITDVRLDAKTKEILQQVTDAENKREVLKREQENLAEQAKNIEMEKANQKLTAEKDAEIATINAKKEADVTLIKAKAQADANRELEKSLTNNVVNYEWIKKWDGKQPVVGAGSNSIVNLPESVLTEKK